MKKPFATVACMLTLVAGPVMALDPPPDKPSYDRPSFDRPDEPEPPSNPPPDQEKPSQARAKSTVQRIGWDVVCSWDSGHLTGKYSPMQLTPRFGSRVAKDLYPSGIKFCRIVDPRRSLSVQCLRRGKKINVVSSLELSSREARLAREWCTFVVE